MQTCKKPNPTQKWGAPCLEAAFMYTLTRTQPKAHEYLCKQVCTCVCVCVSNRYSTKADLQETKLHAQMGRPQPGNHTPTVNTLTCACNHTHMQHHVLFYRGRGTRKRTWRCDRHLQRVLAHRGHPPQYQMKEEKTRGMTRTADRLRCATRCDGVGGGGKCETDTTPKRKKKKKKREREREESQTVERGDKAQNTERRSMVGWEPQGGHTAVSLHLGRGLGEKTCKTPVFRCISCPLCEGWTHTNCSHLVQQEP